MFGSGCVDKQRHVEQGRASNLHFGSAAHRPNPINPRPAAPAREPRGGRPGKAAGIALLVVAVLVVGGSLATCYRTMWRSIPVTVNGEEERVRIGTHVDELLEDNGYFGVKPGRLLSVSGNVISEDGGDRCALAIDGKAVAMADLAATEVPEGAEVSVGDGADVTEPHEEQTVPLAPGIQMESGGAVQYVSQWGAPGSKLVWKGSKSGEVVDKEVVQPPTDMVVSSRSVRPAGGKYMALTFDDGPSKYTPQILDILKEKGVHATFYNLGNQEERFGKAAKRVVEEGHELASHTNAHQYLPELDAGALRAEITSAQDAIEGASGVRPMMMRAPYGAFTAQDWGRAGDLISCNVLWNIDTLDWKRPGADAIRSNVLNGAFNGAIVLMHDGGGDRSQDVEALPGIIDGLQKAGYQLVTVSELMGKDESFPSELVEGEVKMPKGAALPGA